MPFSLGSSPTKDLAAETASEQLPDRAQLIWRESWQDLGVLRLWTVFPCYLEHAVFGLKWNARRVDPRAMHDTRMRYRRGPADRHSADALQDLAARPDYTLEIRYHSLALYVLYLCHRKRLNKRRSGRRAANPSTCASSCVL